MYKLSLSTRPVCYLRHGITRDICYYTFISSKQTPQTLQGYPTASYGTLIYNLRDDHVYT